MAKNKTKSNYIMIIGIFIVLIFVAVWLSNSFKIDVLMIGGDNIKLLNELNSNWSLDKSYTINKIDINGMYAEMLSKNEETSSKVILKLHGGAYVRNLNYRKNLYQRIAEQYAKCSGYDVLTIDYRVAPENPYPAALEDALSAYNYLIKIGYNVNDIIFVGDSAGGGLALALSLFLRDNQLELPCAIVTMSAWTKLYYPNRVVDYIGLNDPKTPYISPYYGEYYGFPKMLMQVGSRDIKDDTLNRFG